MRQAGKLDIRFARHDHHVAAGAADPRWSLAAGNGVVPSDWQTTAKRVCELAKVYGIHRTTVSAHVARAGKTRPVMTEAQIDEAVRIYGLGWTLPGVGRRLGAADKTVRRVLVERAVTIRPGGRGRVASVA